jgi:hypothetical protein
LDQIFVSIAPTSFSPNKKSGAQGIVVLFLELTA